MLGGAERAEDAADPERVADRLAQAVARGELEVAECRLVAPDLDHVEDEVGAVERGLPLEVCCDSRRRPPLASDVAAIASAVSSRRGSMSWRAISTPRSAGRSRMSPSRFFVKTTLPAPTNAILVIPCSPPA